MVMANLDNLIYLCCSCAEVGPVARVAKVAKVVGGRYAHGSGIGLESLSKLRGLLWSFPYGSGLFMEAGVSQTMEQDVRSKVACSDVRLRNSEWQTHVSQAQANISTRSSLNQFHLSFCSEK